MNDQPIDGLGFGELQSAPMPTDTLPSTPDSTKLLDLSALGALKFPVPPSDEEMYASRSKRFVQPMLDMRKSLEGDLFPAVSLEGWIKVAQAAGVAHVPSEVVCRIPVKTAMMFDQPAPGDNAYWADLTAAKRSVLPCEMMRWDCCASIDTKARMDFGGQKDGDLQLDAEGSALSGKRRLPGYLLQPARSNPDVPSWRIDLSPDDPRFADIAYTYPGDFIAVHKRPWIDARMEGSHPAEYRVFVENNEVVGIANYYIQRDLEMTDAVKSEIVTSIASAMMLVDHMARHDVTVFNRGIDDLPTRFDARAASCTMDFLVAEDGRVLFLEAGPPFGLGAHPCAFMNNVDEKGRISVSGVALGVDKPVTVRPEAFQELLQAAEAINDAKGYGTSQKRVSP